MNLFMKLIAGTAAVVASASALALPRGFYVQETNGNDHIIFHKTAGGNVSVMMNVIESDFSTYEYQTRNNQFQNQICTKMKNQTPIGGPRFHCSNPMNREPYTLHIIDIGDGMVADIRIWGDGYPGFGITYDDVQALMNYWSNE